MDSSLRGQILALLHVDNGFEGMPEDFENYFDGDVSSYNVIEPNQNAIRESNVMGFVHVTDVTKHGDCATLSILAPCVSRLPRKCMLKGDIAWHDR